MIQSVCISTTVEDEKGDSIQLHIYNCCRIDANDGEMPINIGQTIIIKEPYCKMTVSGDIAIRIDNPLQNIHSPNIQSMQSVMDDKMKTFVHSHIEMAFIDEVKGRGIRATETINSDAVIVKEASLLFERPATHKMSKIMTVDADSDKTYLFSNSLHDLRFEMMKLLCFGKGCDAKRLSLLYHVPSNRSLGVVDLNVFRNNDDDALMETVNTRNFSVAQVTSMINCNCFKVAVEDDPSLECTAVFVFCSMFNHSNDSNLSREYVWMQNEETCGKYPVAIFKTKRVITKGEELTIDYGYDPMLRAGRNW